MAQISNLLAQVIIAYERCTYRLKRARRYSKKLGSFDFPQRSIAIVVTSFVAPVATPTSAAPEV
jgi:hypothetical protein